MYTQTPQETAQAPKPRRWPRRLVIGVSLVAALGVGIGIGGAGHSAKTVTVTRTVAGPTVTAPAAPAPTVTQTVAPPPPATGATIATFHGSGNEATPSFNVPASGNYIVAWRFSGNQDSSFGSSQPDNFIIDNTGSGEGLGLANDIAVSGHGSSEVTDGSGTDSFNVQAGDSSSWTLTVTAAS